MVIFAVLLDDVSTQGDMKLAVKIAFVGLFEIKHANRGKWGLSRFRSVLFRCNAVILLE